MFKFLIIKIFPSKVESIEELGTTLQREGCKSLLVEVNPSEFLIRFSSVTPAGRKIICHRRYCKACLPDEPEKRLTKAIAILYPIAESEICKLKQKVAAIKVNLITV